MTFKKLFFSITKKEWQFVWLVSLILIVITTLPVVYGYFKSQPDQVFTAMHFVSADDWFVYYSLIDQARAGNFLAIDLFAPVTQIPVLQPFWFLVGFLAWLLNLSAWAAMHFV